MTARAIRSTLAVLPHRRHLLRQASRWLLPRGRGLPRMSGCMAAQRARRCIAASSRETSAHPMCASLAGTSRGASLVAQLTFGVRLVRSNALSPRVAGPRSVLAQKGRWKKRRSGCPKRLPVPRCGAMTQWTIREPFECTWRGGREHRDAAPRVQLTKVCTCVSVSIDVLAVHAL